MLQDYTFGCMQNTKNTTNKTLENKELNIIINCDEITGGTKFTLATNS